MAETFDFRHQMVKSLFLSSGTHVLPASSMWFSPFFRIYSFFIIGVAFCTGSRLPRIRNSCEGGQS
jgi:hypothetical protein